MSCLLAAAETKDSRAKINVTSNGATDSFWTHSRSTCSPSFYTDIMKLEVAYLVAMVAMATVVADPMKKRFLDATSPKDTFDGYASGVDFDTAVNALIPYIHSDMTIAACVIACQGAASYVLGPAAILSGFLCPPLCDEGLKRLEEQVG
ncbi:hypothetical protein RRG08_044556 [Elysia crispata]|uniref:Uncharacterized protein n=1 Tax=Elysia crispata TaxID=231223 RepID=A0AAE0ZBK1_9GAST|nr:hypothetical protein RRG08_044556 [Elysia crispata]